MSTPDKPSSPSLPPNASLKVYIIGRWFDFLSKLADLALQAVGWRLLLIVAGTFLGTLALLPVESRLGVAQGFLHVVGELAAPSTWVNYLGWIILVVFVAVGGMYYVWSERRIDQLGGEVRTLRETADPSRKSSRDPARSEAYAKQVRVADPSGGIEQHVDQEPRAPATRSKNGG